MRCKPRDNSNHICIIFGFLISHIVHDFSYSNFVLHSLLCRFFLEMISFIVINLQEKKVSTNDISFNSATHQHLGSENLWFRFYQNQVMVWPSSSRIFWESADVAKHETKSADLLSESFVRLLATLFSGSLFSGGELKNNNKQTREENRFCRLAQFAHLRFMWTNGNQNEQIKSRPQNEWQCKHFPENLPTNKS